MNEAADWLARQFVAWRADPERFCREFLGWHPWRKQVEVLEAVRDCDRVAVPSAHGVGKSALGGAIAWWWKLTREPSKVIITAPGGRQAATVLGGEVRARYDTLTSRFTREEMAALGLGTAPTSEGWRRDAENFVLWFATSRDAAREHATRATGFHSPHLLAVFEEAGGIPKAIRDSMDGVLSDDGSRELAIGNPSDPSGWFAGMCRDSAVRVIRIDAEQFPNVVQGRRVLPFGPSRKWVQAMRKKWGESSGSYQWKVRGRFPTVATDSLIGYSDVLAAFAREGCECPHAPADVSLGVDPARFGDDDSVIFGVCRRCGRVLRVERRHGLDVVKVAGLAVATATALGLSPREARQVAVDGTGLGAGVVDRLREAGWHVRDEVGSARPQRERIAIKFANRRAELWWGVREWLRGAAALADLDDESRDRLLDELTSVKYHHDGTGRVLLESKDEIKRRIGRSPDDADALSLAVGALRRERPFLDGSRTGPTSTRTKWDERDDPDGGRMSPSERKHPALCDYGGTVDQVIRDLREEW